MFLTEKCSGEIKARGCADGQKQQEHIAKEESTTPTVSTDALFITSVIAAHEQRDVASADIPGAFLHAENDECVTMRLDGVLAKMMVKIAPELHRPFITSNASGKPVLYVNLEKALYGQLKCSHLFYCKLVADLTSLGFTIVIPYDPCVANKLINGKQMMIIWHIDNLLISHVQSQEVDKIIDWLSLCNKTPNKLLKATCGAKHNYLGMTLKFNRNRSLVIGMDQYIHKIIHDFPECIMGMASSLAADHLYQIHNTMEARPPDEE